MNRAFTIALALLVVSALVAPQASSQVIFEGCRDADGRPVASVVNFSIADVAQASAAANGMPVIYYNPRVLVWMHPQTRVFFYTHECGHHALGQILSGSGPSLEDEQEADCWGIRTLRKKNLISEADLQVIQSDIARFGRADWSHLPGPERAINLRACLAEQENAGHGEKTEKGASCRKEYDSCVEDIQTVRDCVSERRDSCMDDCENHYGYSPAACSNQFCNPQQGSNGAWIARCQATFNREKAQCERDRRDCAAD